MLFTKRKSNGNFMLSLIHYKYLSRKWPSHNVRSVSVRQNRDTLVQMKFFKGNGLDNYYDTDCVYSFRYWTICDM